MARLREMPGQFRQTLGWLYGAVACPFLDFFRRLGWFALVILLFIGIYKLSDVIMGVMASPFYIVCRLLLEKKTNVTKLYGFIMSVAGGLIGGVLFARWGVVQ